MLPTDEYFTLHSSVGVRWWLTHLPHASAAADFLDQELVSGRLRVVAADGIAADVLQAVLRDLRQDDPRGMLTEQVAQDVTAVFDQLRNRRALRLVPERALRQAAARLAAAFDLDNATAMAVVVCAGSSLPLLVADEGLYRRLTQPELGRRGLQAVWLPDYAAFL